MLGIASNCVSHNQGPHGARTEDSLHAHILMSPCTYTGVSGVLKSDPMRYTERRVMDLKLVYNCPMSAQMLGEPSQDRYDKFLVGSAETEWALAAAMNGPVIDCYWHHPDFHLWQLLPGFHFEEHYLLIRATPRLAQWQSSKTFEICV